MIPKPYEIFREARLNFAIWYLHGMPDGERERERDLTLIFCSRETWLKFTISGYVNLTNYMVATSMDDVPLQDVVLGV